MTNYKFTPEEFLTIDWCNGYTLTPEGTAITAFNTEGYTIFKAASSNGDFHLKLNGSFSKPVSTRNFLAFLKETKEGLAVGCYDYKEERIYYPSCSLSLVRHVVIPYDDNSLLDVRKISGDTSELRKVSYKDDIPPETLYTFDKSYTTPSLNLKVSQNGEVLIILKREESPIRDLYILDRDRQLRRVYEGSAKGGIPVSGEWNHDGSKVSCLIRRGRTLLCSVVDLKSGTIEEIPTSSLQEGPVWHSDSNKLVVNIDRWPTNELQIWDADKGGFDDVDLPKDCMISKPAFFENRLYYIGHTPDHPPTLFVYREGSSSIPLTRTYDQYEQMEYEAVDVPSHTEEHSIPCILFKGNPSNHKTIIMLHGGPSGASWASWTPVVQSWVHEGYQVLRVNPRGSTVRNKPLPPLRPGEFGDKDVEDVLSCIHYCKQTLHRGDEEMFLYGESYGGFLAYETMMKCKEDIAGLIIMSGYLHPSILLDSKEANVKRFAKYAFKEDELMRAPNSLSANCPILQVHGEYDHQLPFEKINMYFNKLEGQGHQLLKLPKENHGFRNKKNIVNWLRSSLIFMDDVSKHPQYRY